MQAVLRLNIIPYCNSPCWEIEINASYVAPSVYMQPSFQECGLSPRESPQIAEEKVAYCLLYKYIPVEIKPSL